MRDRESSLIRGRTRGCLSVALLYERLSYFRLRSDVTTDFAKSESWQAREVTATISRPMARMQNNRLPPGAQYSLHASLHPSADLDASRNSWLHALRASCHCRQSGARSRLLASRQATAAGGYGLRFRPSEEAQCLSRSALHTCPSEYRCWMGGGGRSGLELNTTSPSFPSPWRARAFFLKGASP